MFVFGAFLSLHDNVYIYVASALPVGRVIICDCLGSVPCRVSPVRVALSHADLIVEILQRLCQHSR